MVSVCPEIIKPVEVFNILLQGLSSTSSYADLLDNSGKIKKTINKIRSVLILYIYFSSAEIFSRRSCQNFRLFHVCRW